MKTIRKDPDETIVETIDWKDRLDLYDFITGSSWVVGNGLTKGAVDNDDGHTQVSLSGGTLSTTYLVTNTVTTSKGNIWQRSFRVFLVTR